MLSQSSSDGARTHLMTRVLIISSSFSAEPGTYHSVCQDLADAFEDAGLQTIVTSRKAGRVERVFDMLATVWSQRRGYDIALIDVYSGWAFVWAFLCGALLKLLGKPYILTLHGGNLPNFSKRWIWFVKWLLRSASSVNTPSNFMMQQMQPYR